MQSLPDAREQYRALQNTYHVCRDAKQYDEAFSTLEKIIALLENDPAPFDEPEEQIRILRCQQTMIQVERNEPTSWSKEQAELLRTAASWSTPSVCVTAPCGASDSFEPAECLARQPLLSRRQSQMCVERINYICHALKIEAAAALRIAETRDWNLALTKRQQAAAFHRVLLQIQSGEGRKENQLYLDYWAAVTEGQVLLLRKDFPAAKRAFREALEAANRLDPVACFPNVFRDVREIQAHLLYIDAVAHATAGDFDEASNAFQGWLNLFPERASERDTRYDSVTVYSQICGLLARLKKADVLLTDWERIDTRSRNLNLALPTRALLRRLRELMALCSLARRRSESMAVVLAELDIIAGDWPHFLPDADLVAQERASLPRGEAHLPIFLNIFHLINPARQHWGNLLLQNLKHLLLLMGDYEVKRHANPPDEEKHLAALKVAPVPRESMTLDELAEVVLGYLRRRDAGHATRVAEALGRTRELRRAIAARDAQSAITIEQEIFQGIRLWPHTILVTQQSRFPTQPPRSAGAAFVRGKTLALRLWAREPREIALEGPHQLTEGTFYYLRPKWNTWFRRERRVRHHEFHEAELPGVLCVFHRNLSGEGAPDSERFQDWLFGNFSDRERLRACRLLGMLRFYGPREVREAWLRVYRTKFPPELKVRGIACFGLGSPAKSGNLNLYYFRQALEALNPNERSFAFKDAFCEISTYDVEPRVAIFIDDFIGTGDQALRILDQYFVEHPWLAHVPVYYAALVGFRSAIEKLKNGIAERVKGIFVADELDEADRAFSPVNERWPSARERELARDWAADIGADLIAGMRGYNAARDSLGWGGSEALVAFHYNVPNNTLPLFWADGERNGKRWHPLLDRY
jgi:tetratricopeptide (TPR) repeat protein